MKRNNGEIQVISVSFLDLLSNALGVFLMLLLWSLATSQTEAQRNAEAVNDWRDKTAAAQQQAEETEKEIRATKRRIEELLLDLEGARKATGKAEIALGKVKASQEALELALRKLARLQSTLAGLQGELKGVVFVFDTSGSMNTPRWPDYLAYLNSLLAGLQMERFNVVQFETRVHAWRDGLVANDEANRKEAMAFVNTWKPVGATNTLDALRTAYRYAGVDTIVLFSDGTPSRFKDGNRSNLSNDNLVNDHQAVEEVLAWVRQEIRRRPEVRINAIAMGNYGGADQTYVDFLRTLARETNGLFHGR